MRSSAVIRATLAALLLNFVSNSWANTWVGATATWGDPNNWSPAAVPVSGGTATFTDSGNKTPTITGATPINRIEFTFTGASAVTYNPVGGAGGTFVLDSGGSIAFNLRSAGSGTTNQTITAPIDVSAGDVTFTNDNVTAAGTNTNILFFTGALTGPANRTIHITSAGAGGVTLPNTFPVPSRVRVGGTATAFLGTFSVDSGFLEFATATASGDTLGGTILNGGRVGFNATTSEPVSVVGTNALMDIGNNVNYSGTVTMSANRALAINPANTGSTFSGVISGDGTNAVTITHGGLTTVANFFTISGTASNTAAGLYSLNPSNYQANPQNGTYVLAKTAGLNAIAGDLTVNNTVSGATQSQTVQWTNSDQVIDTSIVTLNAVAGAPTFTPTVQLRLQGQNEVIGGLVSTGGGVKIIENNVSGTSTLTTNVVTAGPYDFGGVLQNGAGGTLAFTMNGSGKQILSGANTYTGTTAVNGGTLLVNGTHTGGSLYTIGDGVGTDTLGGIGSIGSTLDVAANGVLAPGASIGTLSLTNGGDVNLLGKLLIEVDGTGAGTVDLLNTVDALTITAGTVDFSVLAALDDPAYVFAKYTTLTGPSFATVQNLPANYQIDYNYQSGNQIALVAAPIPEPSTFALAGFAVVGLISVARRRQVA